MDNFKFPEELLLDELIEEAKKILSDPSDLNNKRESLSNILDKIVHWRGTGSSEEQYFDNFQQVMVSMALLDFTHKLPLSSKLKSIQNLISHSLNTVNEELDQRVFPKSLVYMLLDDLKINNTIVIVTNHQGYIKMFHTDMKHLYPREAFEGMPVKTFFQDVNSIEQDLLMNNGSISYKVKLKYGYKGLVDLKVNAPSFYSLSEGTIYIVKIPDSDAQ